MSRLKISEFHFPDPRRTLDDGLLCIGGDLKVATLLEAYSKGVFPWPQEGYPLLWFSPQQRGVLDFDKFHSSKSLNKLVRKAPWKVTLNQAFSEVIQECADQSRPGQLGTWILPAMISAYTDLHSAGYAHSLEVWDQEELIGGIYGVYINGSFSGESMFFRRSNASKYALYHLVHHLKTMGLEWMDIQMVTPNLASMGGFYISRDQFLQRLEKSGELYLPFSNSNCSF